MIILDDEGFYFDRIYILSTRVIQKLFRFYKSEFTSQCRSIRLIDLKKETDTFYNARMEVIAPTAKFLCLLQENEVVLGRYYKISGIEIAHDEFCESASDSEVKTNTLFSSIKKRYSYGYIYESWELKPKKERIKDRERGLFGHRTFYSSYENKKDGKFVRFRYILYPRYSKMNNKPCIHEEWRISGAALIARKSGIKCIEDLVRFDFKGFFDANKEKYIVHESLDRDAVGRLVMGYDGRKVLNRRHKMSVGVAAQHFLERGESDIKTWSDFVRFIRDRQSQIKCKRGIRTALEEKILSLKDFRRFRRRHGV